LLFFAISSTVGRGIAALRLRESLSSLAPYPTLACSPLEDDGSSKPAGIREQAGLLLQGRHGYGSADVVGEDWREERRRTGGGGVFEIFSLLRCSGFSSQLRG
jgi:hypothetical protein